MNKITYVAIGILIGSLISGALAFAFLPDYLSDRMMASYEEVNGLPAVRAVITE
jgi:hypothetical protein